MNNSQNILEMSGIRKSFHGVEVLHSVNFAVQKGKVCALVGENGAGKSTLMKILMGVYHADAGEIEFDGEPVSINSPSEALEKGISIIPQEISLINDMTVAENIFLNREPSKYFIVNKRELNARTDELFRSIGIKINAQTPVRELSMAQMQMLEIAKAVSYNSKVVIMDEPTSTLTNSEVEILFNTIRRLTSRGVSIIYITHKLDELFVIADSITVLRDGSVISNHPTEEVDRNTMIGEMVGRTINQVFPTVSKNIGETILEVKNYSNKRLFKDISFSVRQGEILGFAGMVGAGRTEIVSSVFGLIPHDTGETYVWGEKKTIKRPLDAMKCGMALVPEERGMYGLNLKASVRNNICSLILDKLSRYGIVVGEKEKKKTGELIDTLHIKAREQEQLVSTLSGGNQQKIVISKWIAREPHIFFMDEPTRGIDVGAKYEIYTLINELAATGNAVVVISSEMPELLGICDRIIVVKEGRIVGELSKKDASQEAIMMMIENR